MLNFGGFLSSNFWTNYRCQSSASVEDLLSSPECTVDKLLDDDDCLQEFKNYNDKLIKYFDHDKLKVLVDYITVMPEADEHKRGHKYPFLAAEIFNCEINQVLDKFFEAPIKVKALPPVAADTTTEATDSSVTQDVDKKDGEVDEEKKDSTGEAVDGDADADKKDEEKDATATEESKEEEKPAEDKEEEKKDDAEKEEGAKNLEEVESEKKEEEQPAVEETKKEEPESDEKPPQDGETKEESKEEDKRADSPAIEKEEAKEEEKPAVEETKAETKEDSPEKNTQEPESEEPEKENNEEPEKENNEEPEKENTEEVKTEESKKPETTEEVKASEEPEGEDDKAKEPVVDKDLSTQASQQTLATEAEAIEEELEEEGSKYILLERLFKFIQTEEELNPVLSGYFCKLVSLLISRKQKLLFPYIFAPESTVIEDLLKHVYQKSISEILNKLLTNVDTDHEAEVLAQMKSKQAFAVTTLINSLGSEKNEEHNLNASSILLDMFEIKDFYNLILAKENLTRIADFALAGMDESTKYSKCSSLSVLNQIVLSNIERQKKKEKKTDEDKDEPNSFGDDDMIVQQNSDDDKEEDEASNPNSATAQTKLIVEILQDKVTKMATILGSDHEGDTIASSVTGADVVPLGMQRLYTVELVLRMIQLKQEALYTAMGRSEVFKNIIQLVKIYPWNNFMQLKVITMCEDIFENCEDEQFKKDFLESSGIGKSLVEMGAEASFKMNSERLIRNGYMGLVVSVSNKLVKRFKGTDTKPEDATVVEYLDNCGEEWRAFVDDELANSNANDSKTLGGSSKPDDQGSEEGGDNIDVQMDAIMRRFSNFNSMLNNNNNNDDNDDGDEAEDSTTTEGTGESVDASDVMKIEKVELKVIEPLKEEFIDNSFWNVTKPDPQGDDIDYDALYAELEA